MSTLRVIIIVALIGIAAGLIVMLTAEMRCVPPCI
jgi:hypothetical protein|tara:strand:+ start:883 stop:987 length:105 start_codon:yes stop_codon:yes gene_type:complete